MTLAKASIVNYNSNCSFIVLATVITILNYNRKTFIGQVNEQHEIKNLRNVKPGTHTEGEGSAQLNPSLRKHVF
jgi:hypothetical protein